MAPVFLLSFFLAELEFSFFLRLPFFTALFPVGFLPLRPLELYSLLGFGPG